MEYNQNIKWYQKLEEDRIEDSSMRIMVMLVCVTVSIPATLYTIYKFLVVMQTENFSHLHILAVVTVVTVLNLIWIAPKQLAKNSDLLLTKINKNAK